MKILHKFSAAQYLQLTSDQVTVCCNQCQHSVTVYQVPTLGKVLLEDTGMKKRMPACNDIIALAKNLPGAWAQGEQGNWEGVSLGKTSDRASQSRQIQGLRVQSGNQETTVLAKRVTVSANPRTKFISYLIHFISLLSIKTQDLGK